MDPIHLFNALAVGLFAGLIFYGGLWLTIRSLATMRLPGLVFLVSFVVRSAACLALLWFGAGPGWIGLGVAVFGMLLVRTLLTRALGPLRVNAWSGASDKGGG